MIQYPSIPHLKHVGLGRPCVALYKYDGSNLRWEWRPKSGWSKFGTRHQLFDASTPLYNQAIPIFQESIGDVIVSEVTKLMKRKVERIVAFTEFFGPSSFAGSHDIDEPKQLKLFDVSVYKQGFVNFNDFSKMFSDYAFAPEIVYVGNLSASVVDQIVHREQPFHALEEGIVACGHDWKTKIKTKYWLDRLKGVHPTDWEKYA